MAEPAKQSEPSGKPLLWAVGAGIALVSAGLFVLLARDPASGASRGSPVASSPGRAVETDVIAPSAANPAEQNVPGPARGATGVPVPSAPPPVDLFQEAAPEIIGQGHVVVSRGGMLNTTRLKELYEFSKEHPNDARPQLVMAGDAMNRGWAEFAVSHYARAQKADPRARQDPRMLKDLVSIAGNERGGGPKARDALSSIYGGLAVTSVEAAIAEAGNKGDMARVERLTGLSQALSSAPAVP